MKDHRCESKFYRNLNYRVIHKKLYKVLNPQIRITMGRIATLRLWTLVEKIFRSTIYFTKYWLFFWHLAELNVFNIKSTSKVYHGILRKQVNKHKRVLMGVYQWRHTSRSLITKSTKNCTLPWATYENAIYLSNAKIILLSNIWSEKHFIDHWP